MCLFKGACPNLSCTRRDICLHVRSCLGAPSAIFSPHHSCTALLLLPLPLLLLTHLRKPSSPHLIGWPPEWHSPCWPECRLGSMAPTLGPTSRGIFPQNLLASGALHAASRARRPCAFLHIWLWLSSRVSPVGGHG